jgi:hypothetical protein
LEIRAPDLVGGTHGTPGYARMPDGAALAPLGHQMVAAEDVTDGRQGRPWSAGRACAEDRHQLLRALGWMPTLGVEDRRHHMVRRVAG